MLWDGRASTSLTPDFTLASRSFVVATGFLILLCIPLWDEIEAFNGNRSDGKLCKFQVNGIPHFCHPAGIPLFELLPGFEPMMCGTVVNALVNYAIATRRK